MKIYKGRSDFMFYYNKCNQELLFKEDVSMWECIKEDCIGWSRKNFVGSDILICFFCGSKMIDGVCLLVNF